MTKVVAVTGSRELTQAQTKQAAYELYALLRGATKLHVGDARGIDDLAATVAQGLGRQITKHHAGGSLAWQLQKRSRQMVDALAADGGTLHGWVNKPCPQGLTVSSWKGSGTWGTLRYAVSKGVEIELHWLIEPAELPDWMEQKQLSLLAP